VEVRPAPCEALEDNLCWLLSRASYTLTTEIARGLEEVGVSPRGHAVLSAALTGEHTQTELASLVGLDKTTMVVTVDELESAGLAKRLPSERDRRARVISVTKAGERKVRDAERIADQIRDDVLGALEPDERKVFMDSLSRLVGGRLSQAVDCSQSVRRRGPRI
jgi:DNA-binding MarR family transcriptional regulator